MQNRTTIIGAIKLVLQSSKNSLSPRVIFDQIIKNNYYKIDK
jgi:ABC-type dipeptide/oligopeptide/nickel transport system ATPase subunit